ncbi:unnamed protein product [Gongylonema pulchrum]|uniref:Pecanex-like protein n=1 Tax=Gongylonema pulchrum TaxID=637853 RepID=A0A183DGG7_9BILA|nr:unnamed protein product [Gongylonema pulchrum]
MFLGRLVLPWSVVLVIHHYRAPVVLFVVSSLALFVAYISLTMTLRAVRVFTRINAVNHFSNCVEREIGSGEVVIKQKKSRNGQYVALINKDDTKCEDCIADDDLDDRDIILHNEQDLGKYAI